MGGFLMGSKCFVSQNRTVSCIASSFSLFIVKDIWHIGVRFRSIFTTFVWYTLNQEWGMKLRGKLPN